MQFKFRAVSLKPIMGWWSATHILIRGMGDVGEIKILEREV